MITHLADPSIFDEAGDRARLVCARRLPVAAGVLYPFFGLLLLPMIASAAMTLSSVSVITNALRLRRVAL